MAFKILKPQEMRSVSGILFDMDGLVLDSEKLYTRFWREAARELGYPMSWEQALGMRRLNSKYGQRYLEHCFGPEIDYNRVRTVRIRRMDAWVSKHGIEAKNGVRELLSYLHSHHLPCAIATSSPPDRVRDYLMPLKLYEQFDTVCSGYEVAEGKPAPDIYLYSASKLTLKPEKCLALEDSPAGIESAWRAGCLPVVIPDQDRPSEETLAKCFAASDSLSDICPLLDLLNE